MAREITGFDESIAFTCLLEFPWFAKADSRVTNGLSAMLADLWRDAYDRGDLASCLDVARLNENDLRAKLVANAEMLGLSPNPIR